MGFASGKLVLCSVIDLSPRKAQTEANLGITFRAVCEQTLLLHLSRLLLVHVEETLVVLTTLALQELSPHVVYLDVIRPSLVCRIRAHREPYGLFTERRCTSS